MMITLTKLVLVIGIFGSCYSAPDHNVEIVGGHQISIAEVPFMVSLRSSGIYHICGGSIIHERFILTAGHCIIPNKTYKILVGTDRADNSGNGHLYDIETPIVHPDYSNKTYDYDIALIKLKKPLNLGPNVAVIQLADKSMKLNQHTMVNVTGWGSTGTKVTYSADLQQVTIPILTRKRCQKKYDNTIYEITHRMVCAGINGKDSCRGDSGGPLTLGKIQIGITSFGFEKCGDIPGVYTKVSVLKKWIDIMISKNL